MQEKKAPRGISVSVTVENSPEDENNSIYVLDLSMCSSSWKVSDTWLCIHEQH